MIHLCRVALARVVLFFREDFVFWIFYENPAYNDSRKRHDQPNGHPDCDIHEAGAEAQEGNRDGHPVSEEVVDVMKKGVHYGYHNDLDIVHLFFLAVVGKHRVGGRAAGEACDNDCAGALGQVCTTYQRPHKKVQLLNDAVFSEEIGQKDSDDDDWDYLDSEIGNA